MTFSIVKDDDQFIYLTDKFGEDNTVPQVVAAVTELDRAKIKELKAYMYDEMTLVVRDEKTGEYGIFIEASEYLHDSASSKGDNSYDGVTIAGRLLHNDELPTLEEAIEHCSFEAEKLAERFPDLHIEVRHGDNTWDGAVMLTAFVPETSPMISNLQEIGDAMFDLMKSDHSVDAAAPTIKK